MSTTKHHILYPHRLWQSYSGEHKKMAAFLRGKFIIRLPEATHSSLHKDADAVMPEPLKKVHAPSVTSLAKVYVFCRKAEDELDELSSAEKIEWLIERFDDGDPQNEPLLTNLRAQLEFLRRLESEGENKIE